MSEPNLRIFHGNFSPVISQAVRKPCPRGGEWVSPFPLKMVMLGGAWQMVGRWLKVVEGGRKVVEGGWQMVGSG